MENCVHLDCGYILVITCEFRHFVSKQLSFGADRVQHIAGITVLDLLLFSHKAHPKLLHPPNHSDQNQNSAGYCTR